MKRSDKAVVVQDLEKSFGDLRVLDGINFTVEKGSIFTLLGSNGAGKTTAINILATLMKPDRGTAAISGFDVVLQPQRVREQISLTGQSAAVDEILTGRENLRMIGKLRHLTNADERADELLEQFGLHDAADRPVATYSGGMRRRLDLAMSLVDNPPVVFLDEPTTGLDPQSRLTMWQIIDNLRRSRITVFLTTQYLEEADRLADQIAILHEGKIVTQGTPAELKKLIPHGHIELEFRANAERESAHALLQGYNISGDEDSLKLSIATDGSIRQLNDVLRRIEHGNVSVAEFTQKPPTLEDVFLFIIGEKPRKEAV